jgi:hypothetical protein
VGIQSAISDYVFIILPNPGLAVQYPHLDVPIFFLILPLLGFHHQLLLPLSHNAIFDGIVQD